jgi:uncharacterized protein YvpB
MLYYFKIVFIILLIKNKFIDLYNYKENNYYSNDYFTKKINKAKQKLMQSIYQKEMMIKKI